jgi:hypothetical protein
VDEVCKGEMMIKLHIPNLLVALNNDYKKWSEYDRSPCPKSFNFRTQCSGLFELLDKLQNGDVLRYTYELNATDNPFGEKIVLKSVGRDM